MNQLTTTTVFLVIYKFNHDKPNRICLYYDYVPFSVRTGRMIGGLFPVTAIIELPPEMSSLSLADITRLWKEGHWGAEEEVEQAEPVKEEITRRLPILEGIIRSSNQEGEVAAAKALWKRYTGKEWTQ